MGVSKAWRTENIKRSRQLIAQGFTPTAIANILHVRPATVRNWLQIEDDNHEPCDRVSYEWTGARATAVCLLVALKVKQRDIAKALGVHESNVSRYKYFPSGGQPQIVVKLVACHDVLAKGSYNIFEGGKPGWLYVRSVNGGNIHHIKASTLAGKIELVSISGGATNGST